MIVNCVIGQAGSGKSTFIEEKFPKEEYIFFNVGKVLRSMFTCMKGRQDNKNVWEFANPFVYGTLKHCCNISRANGYDVVLDGFPRDGGQLSHMDRYLSNPDLGGVSVVIHALDITREEQLKRIKNRNGSVDKYQEERVDQSRSDFNSIIDGLELMFLNKKSPINYKIVWYAQKDGGFIISREREN